MKLCRLPRPALPLLAVAMLLLTVASTLAAEFGSASHATSDDFRAPLLNPAAVAVGNARGLAVALGYRNDQQSGFQPQADTVSLFLSGNSLSYVFQNSEQTSAHSISLAFEPLSNVYLGGSATLPQLEASRAVYRGGVLLRPLDLLSLGTTARYFAAPEDWSFTFGAGLRPFGLLRPELQDRVTLAVDGDLVDGELLLPRLRVETELVDGLRVDAAFDLERELLTLGASFALSHARFGHEVTLNDRHLGSGTAYAHVSRSRFRSIARGRDTTYVEYSPGPAVFEQRGWPDFFPFSLIDTPITLPELLLQIESLRDDPAVAGVVFINHNLQASYAVFQDIEAALHDFRASGKEVIFYYEYTNTLNYALAASVADRVYLHPNGYLNLVGLSSVRLFLGQFFDNIGIEFVAFRSDEYKSGGDTLARDRMSDSEREALEALLDSLYDNLIAAIEHGRGTRLAAPAAELVDRGPYLVAQHALDAGLVDELLYRDQLVKQIESRRSGARLTDARFPDEFRYHWSNPPAAAVALIYAVGDIHGGESDLARTTGSATLARALREAREDDTIEGVLLRVSSPGGSPLGSDVIAREVALTAREKPVVVSMGAVAASGGYYIAAPAHHIVAQPSTVTGSIGVFAVVPNIEELSQRLGIHWEAVKRGERADFGIPFRRLTPDESALIQQSIEVSYQRFVSVVAEGRSLDRDAVHDAGQGRIWSGAQAAELQLVDQLGGFSDALEALRVRVDPDREIRLVPFSGQRGPLPTQLPRRLLRTHARAQLPREVQLLSDAIHALERHGDEMILMRLPYGLDVGQ
ncbi:MAG: signal peptide peptidase SppA [Spirochaetaceae bacterium]|nr:MAG: signal peptide peptidase SppA [Spirochaetaceae bacterium]